MKTFKKDFFKFFLLVVSGVIFVTFFGRLDLTTQKGAFMQEKVKVAKRLDDDFAKMKSPKKSIRKLASLGTMKDVSSDRYNDKHEDSWESKLVDSTTQKDFFDDDNSTYEDADSFDSLEAIKKHNKKVAPAFTRVKEDIFDIKTEVETEESYSLATAAFQTTNHFQF